MSEAGRLTERQTSEKRQEEEGKEKQQRQESKLCLADTFTGRTCHIADGGEGPMACNCFCGRGRLLLQKLTLEFFNERNGVRKNRERAWSEDKIKVENRVPLSI